MNNNTMSNNIMEPTPQELDTFLTTLESKLRNPFTSLEVSKFASSSSTSEVRMLRSVFSRMQKSLKCKVLIGILAAYPYHLSHQNPTEQDKVKDDCFSDILNLAVLAEEDDWVRVIGQIVQSKTTHNNMTRSSDIRKMDDDTDDDNIDKSSMIYTTAELIVSNILQKQSKNASEDMTAVVLDPLPLLSPFYYTLVNHCDTSISEVDEGKRYDDQNRHFKTNWNASILHVDTNLESKRAADDVESSSNTNDSSSSGLNAEQTGNYKQNERNQNEMERVGGKSAISIPPRSLGITKSSMSSNLSSNQPVKRYGAAASTGMKKKSNIKAILERKKQQQVQAPQQVQAGIKPSQRSLTMSSGGALKARARADAHRTSAHRAAGKFSSRYQGAGSSKMKMIDISTVKNTNKEKMLEEARLGSLKRRIMKAGEEKNDKEQSSEKEEPANKKARPSDNKGIIKNNTSQLNAPSQDELQKSTPIDNGIDEVNNNKSKLEGSHRTQPQPNSSQTIPQTATNHTNQTPSWQQLLDKSNKLSGEDRRRVEQFFTEQYNPTPDQIVYKMKLNEEKAFQPDGSIVKETLYLELDYNTYGFKKLRKIKKK